MMRLRRRMGSNVRSDIRGAVSWGRGGFESGASRLAPKSGSRLPQSKARSDRWPPSLNNGACRASHLCMNVCQFLSLAFALALAGCAASSPRVVSTPVHAGMSMAELTAAFGSPLRTERHSDGGEDWFYRFGSQQTESHPISESSVTETERNHTVGQENTRTTVMHESAIHLSPWGRVLPPLPKGKVVVE